MNCDQCKDLMLLYAMGALEGDDLAGLRAHLGSGCPVCEGRLAEATSVFALLPLSAPPIDPPASARRRLMASVESGALLDRARAAPPGASRVGTAPARTVAASGRSEGAGPPSTPLPAGAESPAGKAAPLVRGGRPAWLRPAFYGGLAASIATALIFSYLLFTQHQANERLRLALAQREAELVEVRDAARQTGDAIRFIQSPALQVVNLKGTDAQKGATARLLWDPASNALRLYAAGLPPLPPDRAYELWLINSSSAKIPAGTFTVNDSGKAVFANALPQSPGPLAAGAVTDEKSGGETSPKGQIRLLGTTP